MTGGRDGNWYGGLSSTEILPSLTSEWKVLESASLPRAMYSVRAVSVHNTIILTGITLNISTCKTKLFLITIGGVKGKKSYSNSVFKFNASTETWKEVGVMSEARSGHAMSIVNIYEVKHYCV